MTVLMFFIFAVIAVAFSLFSLVIFYHISKFSYIGDVSKRVFFIFSVVDCFLIMVFFVLMIINHLMS